MRRRLLVERLSDRRVLASITGAVFEDANFSFQRDEHESNLPARLVFLDANANEKLDAGETLTVAEDDGTFKFDDVVDGDYLVRMFNGTSTQIQTTPAGVSSVTPIAEVSNQIQFESIESGLVSIDGQTLSVIDAANGLIETIPLGDQVSKMQTLPDGRILVIGSDSNGQTNWLVDLANRTATQVSVDGQADSTAWSDLAIDGGGRGVLLERSDDLSMIRSVNASNPDGSILVTTTSTRVPANTQVLTSPSGNRSILAWSGGEGLTLALWSNVTATAITYAANTLPDASELLAFDDDAGLLAVRTIGGGVRLHDVDGNFAALHTWEDLTGPIAIDGGRELLVSVSSDEAILRMLSLRDGSSLANFAIDLSAIGPVTSLSFANEASIQVLGAAGLAEISLRKPAAHQVTVRDGQDPDPILFGVTLDGPNQTPNYQQVPSFETDEDVTLTKPAPAALMVSSDADGDQYVLVQRTEAQYGVAVVDIEGRLTYSPIPNFNGNDRVEVVLHDGRGASDPVNLNIRVNPVADSPSAINFNLDPVPENASLGSVIGNIEIIDADGIDDLVIEVMDPRFGVNADEIIFLGGQIDFKEEPEIQVPLVVTDPATEHRLERIFALTITDSNEPIRGISPDEASVPENDEGGFVAFIGVDDGDDTHSHTVTVDDERFQVIGRELRLAPGVALDFETESRIVINLTATENVRNPNSLTEPVVINVGNILEQPQSIQLTNTTVLEKSPGQIVGDVMIDGVAADPRFRLSVDDPRFEIRQGTLKLLDQQIVEYASQSEIELKIVVQDTQQAFSTLAKSFVIQVMENATPFHNHDDPFDVNHSGAVTALDALAIINYLNIYGPGPIQPSDVGHCYDVNADTLVTAIDALLIINEVNRAQVAGGIVGSGEGERIPEKRDSVTPGDKPRQDDVFGQMGRDEQAVSSFDQDAIGDDETVPVSDADSQNSDPSAENVDQTIRLFSETSD